MHWLTGYVLGHAILTGRAAGSSVWQPAVGASWQIILSGSLNINAGSPSISPDVDIFDIDLFTNTNNGTDGSVIEALHSANKKVICYFSAGSFEPDRSDSGNFTESDKGHRLEKWREEQWLDLNSPNVRKIMAARIQTAATMGCDAVDPDNIDGYGENHGLNGRFNITKQDSANFTQFLAAEANGRNVAIGLKNAAEIIGRVLPLVQFSVNEQCVAGKECGDFQAFTQAGKPVFHIEYPNGDNSSSTPVDDTTGWCKTETQDDGQTYDISHFSTVIKNMNLDGWVQLCDGSTAVTPTSNSR